MSNTDTTPTIHLNNTQNGYKSTAIGVIPMDWEVKYLGNLGDFKSGSGFPIDEQGGNKGIPFYKVSDMNLPENEVIMSVSNNYISEKQVVKLKMKPIFNEAIIFAKVGAAIFLERKRFAQNFLIDNNMMAFVPNIPSVFLKYHLDFIRLSKYAQTGALPAYNASDLKTIQLPIPPLPEQQKIAEILSTWDEAIANCKKTINALKERNKGLAQQLLYLTKNSHIQLSKLVERVKKPLIPEPNKLYRQIGIRSHAKGIFYKEEINGLTLGNKSVFYIEPHCFILNIVFAWEHAIAKTTKNEEGMIASHRFPMYKPLEDKLDLDFLLYFFKSKKGKNLLNLASPGGAGRNKTLGQSEFLKLQIPVPDLKKQKYIAEVLDTANQELKSYETKLEALQLQKKGLMQQLLTGKIRVNVK
jgi:restriction endonuclease S subunit